MSAKWLILSLIVSVGAAYSQHQSPPKTYNKDAAQKRAPERIGTEKRPLVVTINPTEADKKEAESREEERKQKSESDRNLVYWTRVLAVLALLQFLALAVHALIFRSQSRRLKESVGAMRDEFISTHRPHIRVKHVHVTSEVAGGKPMEIKLVIVNAGITPATVRSMNLETSILTSDKRLPPRPKYSQPHKALARDRLDSGMTIALPNMTSRNLTIDEHPRLMDGSRILYCYGFVEYTDIAGRIRTTAFCRVWEPPVGVGALSEPGRFVQVNDPDYEYQD